MIEKPFLEFRLDAVPFGPRATELLEAAIGLLQKPATVPSRCAAVLLTADGAMHAAVTEVIAREAQRHAMLLAVMKVLRSPDHRILMAALVRRMEDGAFRLMLPCGNCRMLLYAYGGPDVRILHANQDASSLVLIGLNELLPFADGGPGRPFPLVTPEKPQ